VARTAALIVEALVVVAAVATIARPPLRRRVVRCDCHSNLCCLLTTGIAVGALGGIWVHFIPCIWWACDWGPYDGEAVSGGIMFVGGSLIGALGALCVSWPVSSQAALPSRGEAWRNSTAVAERVICIHL